MPDIFHTLRQGHKRMVQGVWDPVGRNPQAFWDIYNAKEGDFKPQSHRVHREGAETVAAEW